jgi:hypothetical protein
MPSLGLVFLRKQPEITVGQVVGCSGKVSIFANSIYKAPNF